MNLEISDFIKTSLLEYFEEVNINRQIPDIRDGLKPIQRKIIYTMHKNGYKSSVRFVKSARVAGYTTLLHPHSNDGIYDSAVNMVTEFDNVQPLISGHGTFGSITGAPAAAARYTEMRLHPFSEKFILDGINENSVNMVDNFDGSEKEPSVLPTKLPMALVNGTFGIGAGGISTEFPPHSIKSVVDLTVDYLKDPKKPMDDLIKDNNFYPAYPYGGVLDIGDLAKTYSEGEG